MQKVDIQKVNPTLLLLCTFVSYLVSYSGISYSILCRQDVVVNRLQDREDDVAFRGGVIHVIRYSVPLSARFKSENGLKQGNKSYLACTQQQQRQQLADRNDLQ